MFRRSTLFLFATLVALLLIGFALPAAAGDNNGASFSLDCKGFTGTEGQITLTRDNTDNNREAFIVSATDGAGNVIYEPSEDKFFVGGTVSWVGTGLVRWTKAPQYNPLTLRVMSRSGNGFGEQIVVQSAGDCEGLPTFSVIPAGSVIINTDQAIVTATATPDGSTSPAVALNAVPPRPTNEDEVTNLLAGYALVNTDNLSVRSGDGPQYSLVGIVDGGTKLIVLGRNRKFTWWYVQAGDIKGWAKAEFLIMRGDLTSVKLVESKGDIAVPSLFLYKSQPILAVPKESSLPLCTLPGQLEYLVIGRDKTTDWYQVQVTCDSVLVNGWVNAALGAIRNPGNVLIPVTTS
jgi:hypothetical protein